MSNETPPAAQMGRARRWIAVAVALAVIGYAGYAAWHGLPGTTSALGGFDWPLYAVVLALTLVNYGLRYWKWNYLLGRVGIRMPARTNAWVFVTGLAMVITPAKAGELVKPWMVRSVTGAPMVRSVPVLVSERATDGIAVVALAGLGVGTYQAQSTGTVLLTIGLVVAGLVVIAVEPLSMALIRAFALLPLVGRLADRVEEAYRATRSCLAPWPLALTVGVSLVAWWAECVGAWLVFKGLDVDVSLDLATFLYASATVLGAPSPGGLGIADAGLVEGALLLVDPITEGQAVAAALLIRVATLWFGVALGVVALLRLDAVIREGRQAHAGQ